eukprot:TRINITY_DN5614_c2_g1_i1.p1 TRINITY_DN5614_c2_g1~~TRINITY_DN5614_c2_g1_i1.p1  ORF type:complete len:637 (+),score=293.76 TRINITY_DN5614_c2_g1_i1:67-1977(+)
MVSPSVKHFRPELKRDMKYVLVSGGVCSSLGKGVVTSSIGALLKAKGYRVTACKIDPYLNIDAGLMSPYEHGEVFVLDDGGEADLDLGNYERMMNLSLGRSNNITSGKIYSSVIAKERRGDYLGRTVQVVPHVTSEVVKWIDTVAHTPTDGTDLCPHVCVVELGGTVGDIESMSFIEAIRQFRFNLPPSSCCFVHLSYVPHMSGQKTKPTQHTVKTLQALGIQPDLLVARCLEPLEESTKRKISNQCNIPADRVISAHNVTNLFHFIKLIDEQGIFQQISDVLQLSNLSAFNEPEAYDPKRMAKQLPPIRSVKSLKDWDTYAKMVDKAKQSEDLRIAFVGKYIKGGEDAYLSVVKALEHSAVAVGRNLILEFINSTDLQPLEESDLNDGEDVPEPSKLYDDAVARMKNCHGIFVPGGFGDRGIEGKIKAVQLAREWKKPYFGVCLGMQVAIIEFARNKLGLADATSAEFDTNNESQNHVLKYMPEVSKETMGANMRLGARYVEMADKTSMAYKLYGGADKIVERHRHRYEFNCDFYDRFEAEGLRFTGKDETKERIDCIELEQDVHPFFLAVQYHPEFKSRPGAPSPPFLGFCFAAANPKQVPACLAKCLSDGPNGLYLVAPPEETTELVVKAPTN